MPRVKNLAPANEQHQSFVGIFSMSNSAGKSIWHVARIEEGVESKKLYGHVALTDDDGKEITYSSKAVALAFVAGYTYRDNELLEDEEVG